MILIAYNTEVMIVLNSSFNLLPEPWKSILAYIALALFVLKALEYFSNLFINGKKVKSKIISKISSIYGHKKLKKSAIANEIEKTVNEIVFPLQKEFPVGWIKRASIVWVRNETINDLKEGDSIIRLKPKESQDSNIVRGIYYYRGVYLFATIIVL